MGTKTCGDTISTSRHDRPFPTKSDDLAGACVTPSLETLRQAAIIDFDLGDSLADCHLDALCRFVADQCAMPIALVSLVDESEQRFLGKAGTDLNSTPRATSFCATAMLGSEILIVPDARLDARFADYAVVTQSPHIRFYAGAPLVTPEGIPLGALCLLDTEPHEAGLSDAQKDMLLLIADAVMDRLALRRAAREERHATAALNESDLRFRLLADAMPQMAWSARSDGYVEYFNARWYQFTGQQEGACDGTEWASSLHPDDMDDSITAWRRSVETGEAYDIEYRLRRADGQYRWTLTRGLPLHGADGAIVHWFGTCTDIHDYRLALEEREIVSQELSHRIKNIFAVISGLVGLSARDQPSFRTVADMLRERILALGRAHDYVRPHSHHSRPEPVGENGLHGLLTALFAPYEDPPGNKIRLSGDNIVIDDRSATPLALLFHEIATNAAKYGALSVSEGMAALTIQHDEPDHLLMEWKERNGPPTNSTNPSGFGSRLLDLSVTRQLGGTFERHWDAEGLRMSIRVPVSAFNRLQSG